MMKRVVNNLILGRFSIFFLLCFFLTWMSGNIHIANAATPDLRGTYIGPGTQTWWNCMDPISNGTYQTDVVLIIDNQNDNSFSGTAIETGHRDGFTGKNYVTLSGTVDSQSQFSGSLSSSLYIENIFDSSAEGTFLGKLDGKILTAQARVQDIVGDTCSGTGTWDLERIILNLTDFKRVPIFNKKVPNYQSVVVTLSPNPLPKGMSVTLGLTTDSGTIGNAKFENDQKTMTIFESITVKIKGVTNSNKKDNIKLTAKLNGTKLLDEVDFSVRTWPKNFRRISDRCDPMINGVLAFNYTWDSESGNHKDLNGNFIGEWVDYPGAGPKYYPTSPPYGLSGYMPDPYFKEKEIGINIFTEMPDSQKIPTGTFRSCSKKDDFAAIQYYWFRDKIFMGTTFDWEDASSYKILMGPLSIYRFVYKDNDVWTYRIEKHGCLGEMNIPQSNCIPIITGIIQYLLLDKKAN